MMIRPNDSHPKNHTFIFRACQGLQTFGTNYYQLLSIGIAIFIFNSNNDEINIQSELFFYYSQHIYSKLNISSISKSKSES